MLTEFIKMASVICGGRSIKACHLSQPSLSLVGLNYRWDLMAP